MKVHGNTKHGYGKVGPRSIMYHSWVNMRQRCDNKNNPDYSYYGGRGITYDPSWSEFENFLADMGDAKSGESIDRIDNNLGYSKENCRWATRRQQSNNRNFNIRITYGGKTMTISEWADELDINISREALYSRIRRSDEWTVERAFTQKVRRSLA